MSRPEFELSQIIDRFCEAFISQHHPNNYTLRTLYALRVCRTSALGFHKEQCDSCGEIRISYNSCGNRHCPKCQAARQAFWVEDTSQRIIDTKYFHVVFTVPKALNTICLLDSKGFYSVLFSSVWNTLQTFGYSGYGVESGALAILHSWGQNLSHHVHLHCLVPGGALSHDHDQWHSAKSTYLFPVKALSRVYRAKMVSGLRWAWQTDQLTRLSLNPRSGDDVNALLDRLMSKDWDVEILTTCALDYMTWENYYNEGTETVDVACLSIPH